MSSETPSETPFLNPHRLTDAYSEPSQETNGTFNYF